MILNKEYRITFFISFVFNGNSVIGNRLVHISVMIHEKRIVIIRYLSQSNYDGKEILLSSSQAL